MPSTDWVLLSKECEARRMGTSEQALIVFAKVPAPNRVKTRLTTLITPEESAALYEAFLKDAVDSYLSLHVDVRLYFGPSDAAIPAVLQPAGATVHRQKGDGLGARMAAAFAESFVAGYKQLVIIGTDHPTLPEAFIEQSFLALEESRAISIGPSEDGGYYLLGMNSFYPQVFENMRYSHDQVFNQTLERAEATDAEIHIMPKWYDVDGPDALIRLVRDLETATQPLAHTRQVMERLQQAYPSLSDR